MLVISPLTGEEGKGGGDGKALEVVPLHKRNLRFRGKEEVMRAIKASFKMIRQLVETLTPATGFHISGSPSGLRRGKVEIQVHGDTGAQRSQKS